MKKINKIKKGIVKVFDFQKVCECEKSKTYKMKFADNNYNVCEDCKGMKKTAISKKKVASVLEVKKESEKVIAKDNLKVITGALSEKKLHRIEHFLKIAKKEGFEMMVTRQNIIDLERKYHIKRPVWLMKDKTYRLGLGAYSLIRATKVLEAA